MEYDFIIVILFVKNSTRMALPIFRGWSFGVRRLRFWGVGGFLEGCRGWG